MAFQTAAAWYSQGTITTNGTPNIVGLNTNFTDIGTVKVGDLLSLNGADIYQIITLGDGTSAGNNTLITVDRNITAGSAQSYTILRLSSVNPINSDIAFRVSNMVQAWQLREDELIAWLGGTVGGGFAGDGKYTLTDATGVSQEVTCPAQMQADVDAKIAQTTAKEGQANGIATLNANGEVVEYPAVLTGMLGNISNPLTHIPMQRQNDALRLSGVETFTRSTGGTYIDSLDGLVKTAAPDVPRHERMADGGIGMLLEGASDNLCSYSQDLTQAVWQDWSGTGTKLYDAVGIGGVNNTATTLVDTSTTNTFRVRNSTGFSVPADTRTYSVSYWIMKSVSGNIASISAVIGADAPSVRINTATGELSSDSVSTTLTAYGVVATVHDHGDKFRLVFAGLVNNSTLGAVIDIYPAIRSVLNGANDAGATGDVTVAGIQVEALPLASSYMPSVGGTLGTRAKQTYRVPLAGNVGDRLNAFSFVCDVQLLGNTNLPQQLFVSSSIFRVFVTGATNLQIGGTNSSAYAPPVNQVIRMCGTCDGVRLKLYIDGVLVSDSPAAHTAPLDVADLWLGTDGNGISYPLHALMRNLKIYDRALTQSEAGAA